LAFLRFSDDRDRKRFALPNGWTLGQISLEKIYALVPSSPFGIAHLRSRKALGHDLEAELLKDDRVEIFDPPNE
jgi:hypothetical protein